MKMKLALLMMSFGSVACQNTQLENASTRTVTAGGSIASKAITKKSGDSDVGAASEESAAKIGVKNFHQLYRSMGVVTGVALPNATILTTYNKIRSQLPQSNSLAALQSSHHMAIAQLASEFCTILFSTTGRRAEFFPSVDFSAAAKTVFSATSRPLIARALLDRLWGEELETQPDRQESIDQIAELMDELSSLSTTPNNAAGTRLVFTGACAAALGSTGFILL